MTTWHVFFAVMLREDGSPNFEVRSEVPLLKQPPRADMLLLRRKRRGTDGRARVLRRLWGWIDQLALVEFKSSAAPVRRGDVSWWLALVHMQRAITQRGRRPSSVQGVFVVVRRTPTLEAEFAACDLVLRADGRGYFQILGAGVDAKLVVLDDVAAADREPLLELFSATTLPSGPAATWLHRHFATVLRTMGTKLPAADRKLIRSFIATLPAKDRLAGLDPEQRLAGLDPEQLAELAALSLAKQRALGNRSRASRVRGRRMSKRKRTGKARKR